MEISLFYILCAHISQFYRLLQMPISTKQRVFQKTSKPQKWLKNWKKSNSLWIFITDNIQNSQHSPKPKVT